MRNAYPAWMLLVLCLPFVAAWPAAKDQVDNGEFGANPNLPEPESKLIPTIKVAKVIRWRSDEKPIAVAGLTVNAFAGSLQHPRWLYVLPDGDVLVAESDAPPKPDDAKGLKGKLYRMFMAKAGSATPSANRITLLRDTNGDGVADASSVFIQGLNSPIGMALIGNDLYVADTDAVLRFPYHAGATQITEPGQKVADLPAGTINHHWTKNLIASPDGTRLYVTVGSNSNVAENGIEQEKDRACILEVTVATGQSRIFAYGLRNPVGLAWNPETHQLWTAVNERDELGDKLVPDYMTSVKDGGFYGWPYSYYGQHVDKRVEPQNPELVAKAIQPDYALGNHTASLGLAFYEGNLLPVHYRNGAFIGQHGSWNRNPPSGYKLIFVPFTHGQPSGLPEDVLTGFLNEKGEARGRPVDVVVDKAGALLLADDVGNTIWRVTPASAVH
jgi:glucose/arabinose dehydrogenase